MDVQNLFTARIILALVAAFLVYPLNSAIPLPSNNSASVEQNSSSGVSIKVNSTLMNRIQWARKRVKSRRGKFPLTASDELPVNLIETDDPDLDPSPEMLKSEVMKKLMKDHFDPKRMSVERPTGHDVYPSGVVRLKLRKGRPKGEMPDYLDSFGEWNLAYLNGERIIDVDLHLGKGTKKRITKFLWAYSHCPVIYQWKDLGVRFWPRWIKEGKCYDQSRSCSFPPGMTCHPSKRKYIQLLRYYCKEKGEPCQWIKTQYPITVKCKCKC